ncbi:MAG: FecR family protein [Saonia sp.]
MKEHTQPLLDKLLNDSSFKNWAKNNNKNDVAFWNAWIQNNPEETETIYTAKSIIQGIAFERAFIKEEMVDKKLDTVLNHIQKPNTTVVRKPVISFKSRLKRVTAAAAIAIVFIIVALNFANAPQEILHKTGFGEVIDLKLPDGTSVVLNGNSEIRYNKENPRDITLNGEAYFKVKRAHATDAKFYVNTNDLKVEVYGTQFHVNTRDRKTDVALDEGSISLLLNNGTYKKMVPGEFVSYSEENNVVLHEKVNTLNTYALWREGTFVFNNMKLKEVMKYIEHTYGFPSEFVDTAMEEKILTGGIPNENLNICLTAIEKTTGTKIVQKDNKLIILNTYN